jgi:hypothetical protein
MIESGCDHTQSLHGRSGFMGARRNPSWCFEPMVDMLSNISVIQYARSSSSCSIVLCAIAVILCEARAFGLVVVVPEYVSTTSRKPRVVPILEVEMC